MTFKSLISTVLLSVTFMVKAFSQTTIASENFDGVAIPAMPSGWTSNTVVSTTWRTDSSNSSVGYPNVSGLNNMVIRNTDPDGTYILTSPTISTIGYHDITVNWAARNSTNFLSSGSTAPMFEYSTNSGSSWSAITYVENPSNSVWAPENGGSDIILPSSANNINGLEFRWTINIVNNPNGTYRMDDFVVKGNIISGIQEQVTSNNWVIYPNPSKGKIMLNNQQANGIFHTIAIYDFSGKLISTIKSQSFPYEINASSFATGVYSASIVNNQTKKSSIITFEIN